jgi:AraC family transcriptional regulator
LSFRRHLRIGAIGYIRSNEPPPLAAREEASNRHGRQNDRTVIATEPTVDISPREIANRRATSWDGMAAEIVETTRRARIDIRFRAPVHLLVVVEEGVRLAGETLVEGLPQSTLKNLRRKLTFVPAGYFDPATLPIDLEAVYAAALRAFRLFFEDTALVGDGPQAAEIDGVPWRQYSAMFRDPRRHPDA